MEVIICDNEDKVAEYAAKRIAKIIRNVGSNVVLGLATGSSPLGTYEKLAEMVDAGEIDLSQAYGFALDEYVGLPVDHPESYAYVINKTVTVPLKMDPTRVRVLNGNADDLPAEARDFEADIAAKGGVDVQILGIGSNGHIGFNEPMSSLRSRTRSKALAGSTRHDNARFFNSLDEVPRHCLTQGLGTIHEAREVILVAQGEHKADAIARVIEGPLTASVPGSTLQLHPSARVIIDEAAASQLEHIDYYREAFEFKMEWQRKQLGIQED